MVDPQAVAFVAGTLFGLIVARLGHRPPEIRVTVNQRVGDGMPPIIVQTEDDDEEDDPSEAWKKAE